MEQEAFLVEAVHDYTRRSSVDGDALIRIQDKHAGLPKNVGTRFDLPATSASPFVRHFIDDYWSGLARVVGQARLNLDVALRHPLRV